MADRNERLRKATWLIRKSTRLPSADTALWTDDVWVVDSAGAECGGPVSSPDRNIGAARDE
ncbi:hypothetical protein [Streptomyces sp. NPDC052042]|uniref:hypothetical protein n=1 Tax=Streptomyces sp. NPDC052042 TaxID=3365683 RepID=UPI0037CDEAC0